MADHRQGNGESSPPTLSQADLYLENCRLLKVLYVYHAFSVMLLP